jgi:hypothetical protein
MIHSSMTIKTLDEKSIEVEYKFEEPTDINEAPKELSSNYVACVLDAMKGVAAKANQKMFVDGVESIISDLRQAEKITSFVCRFEVVDDSFVGRL